MSTLRRGVNTRTVSVLTTTKGTKF